MTQLVKYDEMCRAIAVAHSVDEVKTIRDKASALEAYARLARDVENEKRCAEIRLRSERRLGELLRETDKSKGGRPEKNSGTGCRSISKFEEAKAASGISDRQARRFQQLAAVPDKQFESHLAGEKKPTTNEIIRQHRADLTPIGARSQPSKVPAPTNDEALRFWGSANRFKELFEQVPTKVAATGMTDLMLRNTIKALKPLPDLIRVALEILENEQNKRRNVANA